MALRAVTTRGEAGVVDPADLLAQTQTPAFKAWFKDSQFVDDAGQPLVVYRGEGQGRDFTVFDLNKVREHAFFFTPDRDIAAIYARDLYNRPTEPRTYFLSAQKVLVADSVEGEGFLREWAEDWYGDDWIDRTSGEQVDPYDEIMCGRLFDYEGDWSSRRWKRLQMSLANAGYDGAMLPDWDSEKGMFIATIVFSPEQIKSATNNCGAFDPQNPDIRA